MERFWRKVDRTGECWTWTASSRGMGYGAFKYKGKVYDAHRFVWFIVHKKFPSKWVLHICNNRKCVNPSHLYEGTPKENYWDMRENGNAYVKKSIYQTPEEKYLHHEEIKKRQLERWHKRGKYLRMIRQGKITTIPL